MSFVSFPSSVGPKILTYVTKVMVQCVQLLLVLSRMETPSHVLMQVLESNSPNPVTLVTTFTVRG